MEFFGRVVPPILKRSQKKMASEDLFWVLEKVLECFGKNGCSPAGSGTVLQESMAVPAGPVYTSYGKWQIMRESYGNFQAKKYIFFHGSVYSKFP